MSGRFNQAAAITRKRLAQRTATPIGNAIVARSLERHLTLKQAAAEIGVTPDTLSVLIWRPGCWPQRFTRAGLVAFLPGSDVPDLLRQGGGRPIGGRRRSFVRCALDECGVLFEVQRWEVEGKRRRRHHFCCPDHYHKWQEGRRRAPALPKGQRRTGRHLVKVEHLRSMPSDHALATKYRVHEETVRLARSRKKQAGPVLRYALETEGLLGARRRPALAVVILDFCLRQSVTLSALADRAGVPYGTLWKVVRTGRARRDTLDKLAPLLGQERACVLQGLTPSPSPRRPRRRRPGRPPTFSRAEALEVHRLIHDGGEPSLAAIGRRNGWYVSPTRHCKRAENAWRYARPFCPKCAPPN